MHSGILSLGLEECESKFGLGLNLIWVDFVIYLYLVGLESISMRYELFSIIFGSASFDFEYLDEWLNFYVKFFYVTQITVHQTYVRSPSRHVGDPEWKWEQSSKRGFLTGRFGSLATAGLVVLENVSISVIITPFRRWCAGSFPPPSLWPFGCFHFIAFP